MASSALEEKINKIRLQNEEIRRRYEEVEADKKNAAKLNALVQLVPSDDWPERREPPEFSAPPKNLQKQKSLTKDRESERPSQHYSGIQERLAKKEHKFAQGDGPPPDPKYNFLADSERETRTDENSKTDEEKNKSRNRGARGGAGPRRRGGGNNVGGGGSREAFFKDNRGPHSFHSREESQPEYEAWRAERDRIDEARINRHKTAEGNWRREWDSNKVSFDKDQPRRDFPRKESNTYDRRNNHYDNDYSNRGHGGSRTYHQSQRNYAQQDYRHPHHDQPHEFKRQPDSKIPHSHVDNRSIAAFDHSIKVSVNQGSQASKTAVMSVKGSNYRSRDALHVNSPSIAGTGRVGPRQKSRITYSSQSDSYAVSQESNSFMRQKSFDEKTAGANFNSRPKLTPKSPFSQRKKEGNTKSPYPPKKEFKDDESAHLKSQSRASHSQRNESRDQRQSNNFTPKSQRTQKRKLESSDTCDVFVVEDTVSVKNDIERPIDNQFHIQNNNSIECETNEIGKEFSDITNVLVNSDVGDSKVLDDTDGNLRFNNEENFKNDSNIVNEENVANDRCIMKEENILYDSNIVNEENILYDSNIVNEENVLYDSNIVNEENILYDSNIVNEENILYDSNIVNEENIKIDKSVEKNENPRGNDGNFDVYSSLVNDNVEVGVKNDVTVDLKKESVMNEKTVEVFGGAVIDVASKLVEDNETGVSTVHVKVEADIDIPFSEHQTINNSKNEEVNIDWKTESKDNPTAQQYEEPIECQVNKVIDVKIERHQQSNDADSQDLKGGDNSSKYLIEPEDINGFKANDSSKMSVNDSGFLDNVDNDSVDETNTKLTIDSKDECANDCKILGNFDISSRELGSQNDHENISVDPVQTDSGDTTKEECKEVFGICDNVSAASFDVRTNEDKENLNEINENFIKDCEANVTENIDQSLESLKVIGTEDTNVDRVEEKAEKITEEPVKIIPEESKIE